MKTLEALVRELPPGMQEEVREFAQFLLEKREGQEEMLVPELGRRPQRIS